MEKITEIYRLRKNDGEIMVHLSHENQLVTFNNPCFGTYTVPFDHIMGASEPARLPVNCNQEINDLLLDAFLKIKAVISKKYKKTTE